MGRRLPATRHVCCRIRRGFTPNCGASASRSSSCTWNTWESLLLVANDHDTKREAHGFRVDRKTLADIDLHWYDLRHEGACRLLAEGVEIRAIQLGLRHSDLKQTQRYLNVTIRSCARR